MQEDRPESLPIGVSSNPPADVEWYFLSNHAHVLFCIACDPEIRMRDVADKVGITERAVQRIVTDLVNGQYLSRTRTGRRNYYDVNLDHPLRHPLQSHISLSEMFRVLVRGAKRPGVVEGLRPVRAAARRTNKK